MPITDLPETNIGLIALFVIVVANFAQTIYGQRKARTHRIRNKQDIGELKEQVANGHDKPLRFDLDRVLDGQADSASKLSAMESKLDGLIDLVKDHGRDIRGLRGDVGEVRGDVRETRAEHRELERRVVDFSKREHPGAAPL